MVSDQILSVNLVLVIDRAALFIEKLILSASVTDPLYLQSILNGITAEAADIIFPIKRPFVKTFIR